MRNHFHFSCHNRCRNIPRSMFIFLIFNILSHSFLPGIMEKCVKMYNILQVGIFNALTYCSLSV